jgi:microcin C transport system permease protein
MVRFIGIVFVLGALGSAVGEWFGLRLPTLSWGFELSRNVEFLRFETAAGSRLSRGMVAFAEWLNGHFGVPNGSGFLWFGWLAAVFAFCFGVFLLVRFWSPDSITPLMRRRFERFRRIRRGYVSFLILIGLMAAASFDQILVGSEALMVRYNGKYYWPAFTQTIEKGEDFGVKGDLEKAPAQYRELKHEFGKTETENWVMMPLWPYGSTNDNITALVSKLDVEDGIVYESGGKERSGLGARVYDLRKPEEVHLQYKFRDGIKQGSAFGWDRDRTRVYAATYADGVLVPDSESWSGEGSLETFLKASPTTLYNVDRPPSGPVLSTSPRHPLGTNSDGFDVISYLFGGLKVNIQAALLYIPIVYCVGITIGLLMGFFGGTFDIVVQRVIEILSNIPFLFLVIIVSEAVPAQWKDRFGLYIILAILAMFGWMGMTYYMRTAALKEKARDYIAASRVLGASTPRILFKHLLPNSVAIVVTLIPFSVSGLVLSLTALDYLGFGLPPKYATWGKLLQDGLQSPSSSPWLVTSAFVALVILLVLVTFVGEAVREAFDPKKFTVYR